MDSTQKILNFNSFILKKTFLETDVHRAIFNLPLYLSNFFITFLLFFI